MKRILAMIALVGVSCMTSLWAENQVPLEQSEKSDTAVATAVSGPESSAVGTSPRRLTQEALNNLISMLSSASGSRVLFLTQGNDPEADSFQREIEEAFLQSGWQIAANANYAGQLRAGLRVFAADDELPDHVSVAVRGLKSIGFEVSAGTGYRAFYETQKAKNPNWSGVEFAPDQDFVILVGPNPPTP